MEYFWLGFIGSAWVFSIIFLCHIGAGSRKKKQVQEAEHRALVISLMLACLAVSITYKNNPIQISQDEQ